MLLIAFCAWSFVPARGQNSAIMDTIGLTALWAHDPTLTGLGVTAAQVEFAGPGAGQFEADPGSPGQPVALFAYYSAAGASGAFPNSVGSESGHADMVAENFYGENTGVVPGLEQVENFEMIFFYTLVIQTHKPLPAQVFNQSFEFGNHNATQDQAYDDYIALCHTVVVSGIGNGGPVLTPSDCYNGLGVAAYGGSSSTGPTADGRCKPDITAPADVTSFSTPLVSGAAAILIQGGNRTGSDTAAKVDSRTVKALLLNGAVKPSGWTHTPTAPLDPHYGAGVLNIFNSYSELAAGSHAPSATGLSHSRRHPPLARGSAFPMPQGWDYRSIQSASTAQGVNHYRIITSGTGALISTLVWNKGYNRKAINRLALFAYDANGTRLASSTSLVDNVQHVYITGLGPGTYELEVVKAGGSPGTPGVVSPRETYALVWDFGR